MDVAYIHLLPSSPPPPLCPSSTCSCSSSSSPCNPPSVLTGKFKSMSASLSPLPGVIQIDGAARALPCIHETRSVVAMDTRNAGTCFDEAETKTGINGTFGFQNKDEDWKRGIRGQVKRRKAFGGTWKEQRKSSVDCRKRNGKSGD